MKLLFGIQATGNGHLTRSTEMISELQKRADVDILISGTQCDLPLQIEPKYRLHGVSFIFGEKGGINLKKTWQSNSLSQISKDLKSFDVLSYDAIVTDFEPLSAWKAKSAGIPLIGLSNQYASRYKGFPHKQGVYPLGRGILRSYAPVDLPLGYFYNSFHQNIFTPPIPHELREAKTGNEDFTLVYLPARHHKHLLKIFSLFEQHNFIVFCKHTKTASSYKNVDVFPLDNKLFRHFLLNCSSVITAGGFGVTTESIFLGKKLLVVPMKGQYEQKCNAEALKQLGVTVLNELNLYRYQELYCWLKWGKLVHIPYANEYAKVSDKIFNYIKHRNQSATTYFGKSPDFSFNPGLILE